MIGAGGRLHLVQVEDLARGMLFAASSDRTVDCVLTLDGDEVPALREFVNTIGGHNRRCIGDE